VKWQALAVARRDRWLVAMTHGIVMGNESYEAVTECLDGLLGEHPQKVERIFRQLLISLHTKGIVTLDQITDEARQLAGRTPPSAVVNPNEPADQRFDDQAREVLQRLTRTYVCRHLTCLEVEDAVNLVHKRDEAESLADVASLPSVSFRVLVQRLRRFCALPLGETPLDASEMFGIRVALARHLISDDLKFIGIAKRNLYVRDYDDLVQRIIGSDTNIGRIGGKAGGMLLAHRIVAAAGLDAGPDLPITIPDSYYLRSDVIEQFLELNRLTIYHSQKYKDIEDIRNEYPLIRGVFRNADFPVEIVHQLRALLEKLDTSPLIIRSSSLLEDRFGSAFSGKYASIFVPNQGPLEVRLRALLGAIGEVYASTIGPDPILYRQKHNLIDYDEEMGVLIQRVVGAPFGDYFLPAFAGVAFSRNEYRWSPRLRREDGFMRLVMGLGTRAVDRVGGDYPRMVAMGAPTVRPQSGVQEIISQSQRTLDVINLKRDRFDSINLTQLLSGTESFPMLDRIVSVRREDELFSPPGTYVDADPADLCVTFDKLLEQHPFASRVQKVLALLERKFGEPVDIEFACDGKMFYLLQCRTQHSAAQIEEVVLPSDISPDNLVFTANKHIRTALVPDIEYVVYINSGAYHAVDTNQRRIAIARVVGRVNDALGDKRFILVGPGRWGTNDIRLGVRVTYADISNAKMLVEVARARDGYMPEVSFGTHFFQDLVEDGIAYLALYPDDPTTCFNDDFMIHTPNSLAEVAPRDADFASEVRVIHVPAVAAGSTLNIVMDGERNEAVAYLAD